MILQWKSVHIKWNALNVKWNSITEHSMALDNALSHIMVSYKQYIAPWHDRTPAHSCTNKRTALHALLDLFVCTDALFGEAKFKFMQKQVWLSWFCECLTSAFCGTEMQFLSIYGIANWPSATTACGLSFSWNTCASQQQWAHDSLIKKTRKPFNVTLLFGVWMRWAPRNSCCLHEREAQFHIQQRDKHFVSVALLFLAWYKNVLVTDANLQEWNWNYSFMFTLYNFCNKLPNLTYPNLRNLTYVDGADPNRKIVNLS